MNRLSQIVTDNIQTQQVYPTRLEKLRNDWKRYLNPNANPVLTISQQYRLELTEMMYLKSIQEDRTLFHLSLTYKPFEDRIYRESDVNRFFTTFYIQHLLPKLLGTKRIQKRRSVQPICLAFVDENILQPWKVTPSRVTNEQLKTPYFPARLHHHAILAVHPSTVNHMHNLIGLNTFASGDFTNKIMTSDLKECEAMRLLYASKMLKKYPDFLSFPDRMSTVH